MKILRTIGSFIIGVMCGVLQKNINPEKIFYEDAMWYVFFIGSLFLWIILTFYVEDKIEGKK